MCLTSKVLKPLRLAFLKNTTFYHKKISLKTIIQNNNRSLIENNSNKIIFFI